MISLIIDASLSLLGMGQAHIQGKKQDKINTKIKWQKLKLK